VKRPEGVVRQRKGQKEALENFGVNTSDSSSAVPVTESSSWLINAKLRAKFAFKLSFPF
jgi:hypothetical protein